MNVFFDYPGDVENPNGAQICYRENSLLLREKGFEGFNFADLKQKILSLKKDDSVLCNIGPYGWLYHYIRERHNLKFRIIRDVHTTLWSGYLLQEHLCEKYSREGDVVIFPSEFTRQVYLKLFDSLDDGNTSVCYPINHFFPEKGCGGLSNERIVLGYLGSVAKEKNFEQILKLFIQTSNMFPEKNVQMRVCGGLQDDEFSENNVRNVLKKEGLSPFLYSHVNGGKRVEQSRVWQFLKGIDLMLAPIVSNIDANPRVIHEANHFGIPVLGSEYGGGFGILPESRMVKTEYADRTSDLINNQCIGSVDIGDGVKKIKEILDKSNDGGVESPYVLDNELLIKLVNGERTKRDLTLNKKTKLFIENLEVINNPGCPASDLENIKKAVLLLLKSDYLDIGKTSWDIVNHLDYHPILRINQ